MKYAVKKKKKRALGNLNYQKFPQLSMVQLALIFSYILSPFLHQICSTFLHYILTNQLYIGIQCEGFCFSKLMISINVSPLLTELLVDSFSDFQIMQHNLSPLESHHITFEALVLMLFLLATLALPTLPSKMTNIQNNLIAEDIWMFYCQIKTRYMKRRSQTRQFY